MPIYEFCCDHCRQTFEIIALQKDDPIAPVCPNCQSPEISRVLSRINIGSARGGDVPGPQVSQKSCASGSCTTIDLPGPSK